jgi:two-component system phosphate regulon response regulator PhoB
MAKQTIFIVEDDSDICRLVQHHLKTAGFATTAFSNGRTVIQEAEQARPSLFLLDVMVPVRTDLSCAARFARCRRWLPLRLFF